jgi:hypothetical protein
MTHLELRLDQEQDLHIIATGESTNLTRYVTEGDEREIPSDKVKIVRVVPTQSERSQIGTLVHRHPHEGENRFVDLTTTDIDTNHALGASPYETLNKASRRGPEVQTVHSMNREVEIG